MTAEELLEKIADEIQRLRKNFDEYFALQKIPKLGLERANNILDGMTLLILPDHLRKTAFVLIQCQNQRGTAEEIASITHRARAVESAYLNTLECMGYIKKERKGRKVFFYIHST